MKIFISVLIGLFLFAPNAFAQGAYDQQYREGKAQVEETLGIDVDSLGIEDEVIKRLSGIENEVNFDDGIDSEETKYIAGKAVNAIQNILAERAKAVASGFADNIICNDEKPRYIPKGSIVSVEGENKVWISRGINIFIASAGAPLMAGDRVVVSEDVVVKLTTTDTGLVTIENKTSFQIPVTDADKNTQCLRGSIQNSILNGMSSAWIWFKGVVTGSSFEVTNPTVSGVRG